MNRVIWSPSAIADLREIRGYIDQFNPGAARVFAARLIEAGESLRAFPHRGRSVPGTHLREWTLVYPYVIRYEIVGDETHIYGVRHGARQ